jgi:hypothetical protein
MVVRGEKLDGDPQTVSRRARAVVGNYFFSRAVTLPNSVGDSRKVAIRGPREIRMVEDHTRTERGKYVSCWLGFPL